MAGGDKVAGDGRPDVARADDSNLHFQDPSEDLLLVLSGQLLAGGLQIIETASSPNR